MEQLYRFLRSTLTSTSPCGTLPSNEQTPAKRTGQGDGRLTDQMTTYTNWNAVNWRERDVDIAKHLKITRERVRQKRKELNQPESPHKHMSSLRLELQQWIKHNRSRIAKLTVAEITAELQQQPSAGLITQILKEHKLKAKRPAPKNKKYPWERVNWLLPNKDIECVWGIPAAVVGRTRQWHTTQEALDARRGFTSFEEAFYYLVLIKQEIEVARRYFAELNTPAPASNLRIFMSQQSHLRAKIRRICRNYVNWDLPDQTIAQIWRRPRSDVERYRSRGKFPTPRWTIDDDSPAFARAVQRKHKLFSACHLRQTQLASGQLF